ncbi:MAG: plasmid mobilization relaxosome protein MobC [Pleurocapsa sp. MO_226.B13]|nr:plasmid mobilization relaxosome protein MobC [Pleurocapsa sp. MO_226.B13]
MPRPKQKVVRENYQLRLLPSERKTMEQKAAAANLKLSEYLRAAGLNKTIRSQPKVPEINRATYVELGRIGNNINQLTKAAHASLKRSGNCNVDPTELSELSDLIKRIRLEMLAIYLAPDDED